MLMFPWYSIQHRINFAERHSAAGDSVWINSIKYNEQMRGGELYCSDANGKIWVVPAHLQPDGKIKLGKEPKAWPKAHNLGVCFLLAERAPLMLVAFRRHRRQRMRGGRGRPVHCVQRPHISAARCCQWCLQANAECNGQVQIFSGMPIKCVKGWQCFCFTLTLSDLRKRIQPRDRSGGRCRVPACLELQSRKNNQNRSSVRRCPGCHHARVHPQRCSSCWHQRRAFAPHSSRLSPARVQRSHGQCHRYHRAS